LSLAAIPAAVIEVAHQFVAGRTEVRAAEHLINHKVVKVITTLASAEVLEVFELSVGEAREVKAVHYQSY
jgi:hypothetical protein